MTLLGLQGKLVAVLGYGQEGKAVTQYLMKHGINPVLFDHKPWLEWPADEQEKIKSLGINFIFGPDYLKELRGFDIVFRSPGVPLSSVKGQLSNAVLTSQTKWFFENCPAKIIGVTGTKGKGTTASLIYKILQTDSYKLKAKSYLTGNIGKLQPLDFLDDLKPEDWVVYELSSFQLQDLTQSPHIGVVLMTTQEHLDVHKNLQEYLDAKLAITKYQFADDFAIINADFEHSMKIGEQGKGKKLYFSRKQILPEGCFVQNDQIVIKAAKSNFQFPISQLQLRGAHNLENVCAAILAAVCAGCDADSIKTAIANFKGLEHRLELVSEKNGIKFYNDSFSTTPETAIAAIQSFSESLIVILGGSSKKSDFTELAKQIIGTKNVKALILIGEETARIKQALDKQGIFAGKILTGAKNMQEIFFQIKELTTSGDVVLLSPACASFDMFKNYSGRGQQFKLEAQKFI